MSVKKPWEDLIGEKDREVIARSGWGKRKGYGKKPAVLVVDALYTFVGAKDDVLVSLEGNPMGIGGEAWTAVARIAELLEESRSLGIPVIYSAVQRDEAEQPYNWAMFKRYKTNQPKIEGIRDSMAIVEELTPHDGELVVKKKYPSAFFGTTLTSYLISQGIDTLIVTGFVTSGCIRATVNDSCQFGYHTIVPQECVADRISISHKIELLDMDLKYADVESLEDVIAYLRSL